MISPGVKPFIKIECFVPLGDADSNAWLRWRSAGETENCRLPLTEAKVRGAESGNKALASVAVKEPIRTSLDGVDGGV